MEKVKDCESKSKSYEECFKKIAEELFYKYKIVLKDKEGKEVESFFLTEVEFYYYDKKNHPDPFVHCECYQKKMGIYLHKSGRGGIDLTFGDGENYLGILIRGVEFDDMTYANGPIKVVDAILKKIKKEYEIKAENENEIYKKLSENNDGSIDQYIEIYPIEPNQYNEKKIFVAPRIGLYSRCPNSYQVRNYRFILDGIGFSFEEKTFVEKLNHEDIIDVSDIYGGSEEKKKLRAKRIYEHYCK